jgi:hypothetical protein
MSSAHKEEHVFFSIEDNDNDNDFNTQVDLSAILNAIENTHIGEHDEDLFVSQTLTYEVNFNVKELMLICEYYGISKIVKANKCNKSEIIYFLVTFENEPKNAEIVCKRRNIWFYITEIKNDRFMKKYVLW